MKGKILFLILAILLLVILIPKEVGATFSPPVRQTLYPYYDSKIIVGQAQNGAPIITVYNCGVFCITSSSGIVMFDTTGILNVNNLYLDLTISSRTSGADMRVASTSGLNLRTDAEVSGNATAGNLGDMVYTDIMNIPIGFQEHPLGGTAINDFNLRGTNGYFGVWLTPSLLEADTNYNFYAMENGANFPLLIAEVGCAPPATGNWVLSSYCQVVGERVILTGNRNLIISGFGYLDLQEGSNVTFTGSNQYINIGKGGRVNVCKGCSFPG